MHRKIGTNRLLSSRLLRVRNAISALALVSVASPVLAAFPETDLSQYYRDFPKSADARSKPTSTRPAAEPVPRSDIIGGGPGLGNVVVEAITFATCRCNDLTLRQIWSTTTHFHC